MKVALSGGGEQLVAVLRGHLDEIAEHVVVPDLQAAHAGRLGIARLQGGDDAARLVAQGARLVERRVVAVAHEAAVALEGRQFVGERRGEFGRQHAVGSDARLQRFGNFGGVSFSAPSARARSAAASRPSRMAARSRGPPRPTTRRDSARARSGAAASRERVSARVAASSAKAATASSRRAIAAGSVSGADSRCASRREPAAVTVRSMLSSSEPRRSPDSVRISSRLARVAWSIAMVAEAASRNGGDSGGRWPSCVRST